jgi:hypothetical protein
VEVLGAKQCWFEISLMEAVFGIQKIDGGYPPYAAGLRFNMNAKKTDVGINYPASKGMSG